MLTICHVHISFKQAISQVSDNELIIIVRLTNRALRSVTKFLKFVGKLDKFEEKHIVYLLIYLFVIYSF